MEREEYQVEKGEAAAVRLQSFADWGVPVGNPLMPTEEISQCGSYERYKKKKILCRVM